jgi:hypothetical protein
MMIMMMMMMKAYKCLGIEKNQNIEHKNKKEKPKSNS